MSPLGAGGAGGAGWANALTQIAKTKDPVPGNVPDGTRLVDHDSHTITIEDKWPKSTFHHLVLPRIPFCVPASEASKGKEVVDASTAPPKLGLAGGRLSGGTSASGNTVPASHLQSLSTLLASPYAAQVLAAMRTASDRAVEQIHSLMRAYVAPGSKGKQKCQVTWSIERAFHAIPSMQTVHLHVYSVDLVSAPLKNAKHYNSFRPGHGFALPLKEIERLVQSGAKTLPEPTSYYAALLKAPLIGRDGRQYRNIPALKKHLEESMRAEVEKAQHSRTSCESDNNKARTGESSASAGSVRSASPPEECSRESKRRRPNSTEDGSAIV